MAVTRRDPHRPEPQALCTQAERRPAKHAASRPAHPPWCLSRARSGNPVCRLLCVRTRSSCSPFSSLMSDLSCLTALLAERSASMIVRISTCAWSAASTASISGTATPRVPMSPRACINSTCRACRSEETCDRGHGTEAGMSNGWPQNPDLWHLWSVPCPPPLLQSPWLAVPAGSIVLLGRRLGDGSLLPDRHDQSPTKAVLPQHARMQPNARETDAAPATHLGEIVRHIRIVFQIAAELLGCLSQLLRHLNQLCLRIVMMIILMDVRVSEVTGVCTLSPHPPAHRRCRHADGVHPHDPQVLPQTRSSASVRLMLEALYLVCCQVGLVVHAPQGRLCFDELLEPADGWVRGRVRDEGPYNSANSRNAVIMPMLQSKLAALLSGPSPT